MAQFIATICEQPNNPVTGGTWVLAEANGLGVGDPSLAIKKAGEVCRIAAQILRPRFDKVTERHSRLQRIRPVPLTMVGGSWVLTRNPKMLGARNYCSFGRLDSIAGTCQSPAV